jgi:hypothetical protein
MNDADRTPRPSAVHLQREPHHHTNTTPHHQHHNTNTNSTSPGTNNEPLTRASFDDIYRSSPEDNYNTSVASSPSMSRSSSKASSIDHAPGTTKPSKPRRPTNYAERTSSIALKRASLPAPQPKSLTLNQSNFSTNSTVKEGGMFVTPTKGTLRSPASVVSTPKTVTLTPVVERARDGQSKETGEASSRAEPVVNEVVENVETPYFPLPPPTRPAVEVARTPATRMYWHQPPTHGMMPTGPLRRSHSIAQVGSSIFLFGGSDGGPSKATDTVFIFDTGIPTQPNCPPHPKIV